MFKLTHTDRRLILWMRFLLWIKSKCQGKNRWIPLHVIAYCVNLEIRSQDKKYFKNRLLQICKESRTLRIGSGSCSQRLHYHTFRLLTFGKNAELVFGSGADFPVSLYEKLGEGGPTFFVSSTNGELRLNAID